MKKVVQKRSLKTVLAKNSLGWRLVLGLAFLCVLGSFLHMREVRVEALEIDAHAKNYVVAEVDFEFPDPEAMVLLKQEAIRDLGTVDRINPFQIKQQRDLIEQQLIANTHWRQVIPVTFEEMYHIINTIEEMLKQARFVDQRTYHKIEELNRMTPNFYIVPYENRRMVLTKEFWEEFYSRFQDKFHFNAKAAGFALSQFQSKNWQIQDDYQSRRDLRQVIEEGTPTRMTMVKAGTRIIEPGEKVNQRHLSMITALKGALREGQNLWQARTIVASLLFTLIIMVIASVYFHLYHRRFFQSLSKLTLYLTIITFTLALAKGTEFFILEASESVVEFMRYPVIVPFASILISVLIGKDIALLSTFFLTILIGLSLAVDHAFFLFINLVTGVVSIILTRNLSKRKEIFGIVFNVWMASIPVVVAFNLVEKTLWTSTSLWNMVSTAVCMAIIGVLVSVILPLLESVFNVMTDITLMEFMDPNNKLLRRLVCEAPGTYQHCLMMGNLAENAATAIGANGLFCRVSTLYHDIGKLINPHAFAENRQKEFNLHTLLSPTESAQVIRSHVTEGVSLAQEYNLPAPFIDIIKEHHGTSLVSFFYSQAINDAGGDASQVDESIFRYAGPKPSTKESGIIMIADTVEAAARTLDVVDEKTVGALVDRLVNDRIADDQFADCDLSFHELSVIKRVIIQQICAINHSRVKYPSQNKSPKAITQPS
ncbi:MAG: hypothetical protein S4CHLAM102_11220 [Chlamydiia bacterium]|nr:hypothetical protein [Chlamydiia bacterium]